MSVEMSRPSKRFKRVGHPPKCATCGTVLMRASELAELLDLPHSTVALRLRKLGVAPLVRVGARDLYNAAQVIPILLRGESRR